MRLFLIIAALVYVLFPRDLIPDFLVGWGWIDDLLVLIMLWRYYRRASRRQPAEDRSDQTRKTGHDRQAHATASDNREQQDPYAILGIAPGATKTEIKTAYRRLIVQYHPDKVQHLGKEFQELAEVRFKAIQQAYDKLSST
jgi:DnaJ like chaperone protein